MFSHAFEMQTVRSYQHVPNVLAIDQAEKILQ